MIVFLTSADTEVLAARRARELLPGGFPPVLAANPLRGEPEDPDGLAAGAGVVLVRLLGGRRAWPEGFDRLRRACVGGGVPLVAVGGEATPDAELATLSTAPDGVVAEAFEYLRQGGEENLANLFRFLADTLLAEGFGFEPPRAVPLAGRYDPPGAPGRGRERPTVGLVFYRAHLVAGNAAFVDALAEALDAEGAEVRPVFCYSLRPEPSGRVAALELLEGVDALVTTTLAAGGSAAADAGDPRDERWLEWCAPALEALDVPVVQAICATTSREAWAESRSGLSPLDAAMQVAIPEFDGRIISVPCSFKEEVEPGAVAYRPDLERARRVARIATALARLRRIPNAEERVAILLSNYPTRHARVGNAVGLDTPASCLRLLQALGDAGYLVDGAPDDGDALIRALIASGGYDAEFLTDEQLRRAPARIPAAEYAAWFSDLPRELREEVLRHWGEPPGDLYVDGGEIVLAGLVFGNVFVGIQPPRGFGERPIAIYHDPDLPPPTTTSPRTDGSSAASGRTPSSTSGSTGPSSGSRARAWASRPPARPTRPSGASP
mgnify:CR=1 FL=1